MKNDEVSVKMLINHISRLEGQLASVKAELMRESPDCGKASTVLSAASRSFASLRRSFVRCFLEEKYVESRVRTGVRGSEYRSLLEVINS